jgi:hypothetical protein
MGLPNVPLPGESLGADSQQIAAGDENDPFASTGYNEDFETQAERDGGFFGSLQDLFGGSQKPSQKPSERKNTAFDRMQKQKQQR